MRKPFIASLCIIALLFLMLSLRISGAQSLATSPTTAAFLPYMVNGVTPVPTLRVTPPQPAALVIAELSGNSDPEYVDIYNGGTTAQDMTGWYLVSVVGQETFYFPAGYVLNSGALVQIESGSSATHNPPVQLFWTRGTVWNNSGDKAVLYNGSHTAVNSACYGIGCASSSAGSVTRQEKHP